MLEHGLEPERRKFKSYFSAEDGQDKIRMSTALRYRPLTAR